MPLLGTFGSNSIRGLRQKLVASSGSSGGSGTSGETKWYAQFSGDDNGLKNVYESAFINWLTAFEASTNVIELRAYFGNENTPTYTITDSGYINDLRIALQNGNSFGNGNTSNWYMGWGCGTPSTTSSFSRGSSNNPSFHFGGTSSCSCENSPVIRPLIGNSNWGGIGGGCNQSSQFIGIGFIRT